MTPQEARVLVARIGARWPSSGFMRLDEAAAALVAATWAEEFAAEPYAEVWQIVLACGRGSEWAPTIDQVRGRMTIVDAPDRVALDDALALFARALGRKGANGRAGAMRWLIAQNEVVALWVIEVGWDTVRLQSLDHPLDRQRFQQSLDAAHHDLVHEPEMARPRLRRFTEPVPRPVLPSGEDGITRRLLNPVDDDDLPE